MNLKSLTLLAALTFSASNTVFAADASAVLNSLEQNWAHAYYRLDGAAKTDAFEHLLEDADAAVAQFSDNAEILVWRGIIKSSYAGAAGGLGALSKVRSSKEDLEHALDMDASVMQGAAYSSLGILYLKVPGWPISFGNNDKARAYLDKALAINPNGIDPNFFYAELLADDGRYAEAQQYAQKALAADPRPGRELADSGRRDETRKLLQEIQEEMN